VARPICKEIDVPTIPHDQYVRWFFAQIDRTPSPAGCWLWKRALHHSGYGVAYLNRRQWQAHRLAYHLFIGPIPDGLWVLHQCDNRQCCNPDHLFLGTQADNMSDCARKGRTNKPHGEGHSAAKLTEDQAREILRLRRETSLTMREIGERFGVTIGAVSGIVNGRNWPHIKDAA
jgi:hypothetical protein